ncbi:MAG: UDP-N-acetylglucosamine 2-epimerase (non-hydrolyzing) [Candidatus Omnitrophica bacterium]|nr:UDP-N-acetylglucosamine 2-epimerase (non-hydrolyzing) [Candidatus Omnitrophota bacterium]MBU1128570.1 UDP-N-acetylglucosamine 2-epimerase (non-hydrolyzing) [Candidatus Omnitrophota bacterium]MBU1784783.1 UDP-N-acetylglucosamine 2-epimerase (non-hydrolyzing) [Candidatus Omnitrophota bacterium]MBU1851574.1 UDP-N-acetylglucosamine 2-epimerase (non-hydrolyzing) [Candidatus Omnitrophota bacterium]
MKKKRKKIMFVVGTRPEIIKAASVIQRLRRNKELHVAVCLSGQHVSMVDQMLEDFKINLKYDLKIMKKDQSLTDIAARLMPKLDKVYKEFKPDLVFVQGDTTTAFIAAFLAFYNKIKVAHIEAGLRTLDRYSPFPEEMNRTLISQLTDRHYAPTLPALRNLKRCGVKENHIAVTGNTGIDSVKFIASKKRPFINKKLDRTHKYEKVILLTAHRRENFGLRMKSIFEAVEEIAKLHPEVLIVYPVHPNPNVKKIAQKMLSGVENIMLTGSLHYRDLVRVMKESYMILTDSGGIQEEATSLGKPVLVLRDKTERPSGNTKLVGAVESDIVRETERLFEGGQHCKYMSEPRNTFGDGRAAEYIEEDIMLFLRGQAVPGKKRTFV